MGRIGKSIDEIDIKKTHHAKAEFENRKAWEEALQSDTGLIMSPEVKADTEARKLFKQLQKTFKEAGLDDALFSVGVNNYCLLQSEVKHHQNERQRIIDEVEDPEKKWNAVEKKDRIIAKIRDQLFLWEKENLGTIAGKLRVIPKGNPKLNEDPEKVTGIAAFMAKREAK